MKKLIPTLLAISLLVSTHRPLHAKEDIMPLVNIRIGMEGICRTVFQGNKIEPFGFKVLGVMEDMIGPGQDLILARLTGDKAEYTGVVSGMSGSPCSIDGKLVGALGYSFGTFTKEPIAGITPIENMLNVINIPAEDALTRYPTTSFQETLETFGQNFFNAPKPTQTANLPIAGAIKPIATPLSFSGVSPKTLAYYQPEIEKLGFQAVLSGGLAQTGKNIIDMPEKLEPGSAVAGQLVRGDIDIAGTGTVTYISGQNVLAFGHPFFNQGYVEMPMATAYIVNTLVSSMQSTKMSQSGKTVGAILQDRSPAIYGKIGTQATMIPVTVEVQDILKSSPSQLKFEVFRNPLMTPLMMLISVHTALTERTFSNLGGNFRMSGNIELDDRTLHLNNYYSGTPQQPVSMFAAMDLAEKLFTLWNNPFKTPEIKSLKLRFDLQPQTQLAQIQRVWTEQEVVRPGEKVPIHVTLQTYRKEEIERNFMIQIPADTPEGELDILASSGPMLDSLENSVKTGYRDYDELVQELQSQRANNKLYLKIITDQEGVAQYSKLLPKLPPSIMALLEHSDQVSSMTPLRRSLGQEFIFDTDHNISGYGFITLRVLQTGEYINQNIHSFSME